MVCIVVLSHDPIPTQYDKRNYNSGAIAMEIEREGNIVTSMCYSAHTPSQA